jgi:hypothetical protein
MSVYRAKDSPFYQYDFQMRGRRFHGATKQTSRREAEKAERVERERAKRNLDQVSADSLRLDLDSVAGRYWNEIGQHHAGADNTWRQLGMLLDHLGKHRLLTEIGGNDVAKLVAWRRQHRCKDGAPISPYTVNDTTEQLKKLFTRAKAWGVRFDHEPVWRDHWLDEPQERVRELHDDEGERLDAEMRDDLAALAKAKNGAFAHSARQPAVRTNPPLELSCPHHVPGLNLSSALSAAFVWVRTNIISRVLIPENPAQNRAFRASFDAVLSENHIRTY